MRRRTREDVPYWGLAINNYWFEVPDYEGTRGQVNNRTAQHGPGGTVRAVISARDPQVPNWIDTFGHQVGVMVFRWFRSAREVPELRAQVVPVASLAATTDWKERRRSRRSGVRSWFT